MTHHAMYSSTCTVCLTHKMKVQLSCVGRAGCMVSLSKTCNSALLLREYGMHSESADCSADKACGR